MGPYRTDRPPGTAQAEMNEAIGGAQNGHRYDQSFEEGNDRCHDDAVHAPPARDMPMNNLSHVPRSRIAFCATIRRPAGHPRPEYAGLKSTSPLLGPTVFARDEATPDQPRDRDS
jgi:hypothetical protein